MHNWIEGLLQHHTHLKYGIGIVTSPRKTIDNDEAKDGDSTTPPATPTSHELDIDVDMLDELAELAAESQSFSDAPLHGSRLHSKSSLALSDEEANKLDSPDEEF
jgi:hypothetical protein